METDSPAPAVLKICVLGDSTTCVTETCVALSTGNPRFYCDVGSSFGIDLWIMRLGKTEVSNEAAPETNVPGEIKLLISRGTRQRFRSVQNAMQRSAHGFIVVFANHLHQPPSPLDLTSHPASYVAEACEQCPGAPILLLPSAGTQESHRTLSEAEQRAAADFAAKLQHAHPKSHVKFANVSCASATDDLTAAVARLAARSLMFKQAAPVAPEQKEQADAVTGSGASPNRCSIM
jgi:hypothetical protein